MGAIHPETDRMGLNIRELLREDRDTIHEILISCGTFTPEEVQVALEVLDEGLDVGIERAYSLFAAETDGVVRGYICIGKTPMTKGTWSLYWICVDPRAQGNGIGLALQMYAEDFIRTRKGERLVLETSGQASYEPARRFYERNGYREAGRIRNFYKPNDDCIIYCKELNGPIPE
jgi:ribosomal protein S18 acetylase RimI-like enzyme